MKKFKLICLNLACALILGCSSQLANESIISQPTVDTSHPRATLITGSSDLAGEVLLIKPLFEEVGLLSKAAVKIQNLTDNRYALEYRIEWESEQGFPVGLEAIWHRFILTPHQVKNFWSVGKVPEAKRIVFTIRNSDDAFIEFDRHIDKSR